MDGGSGMMSRDFCKDIEALFNKVVPSVEEFENVVSKGKELRFDELRAKRPDIGNYIQNLKERLRGNDYFNSIRFYDVGNGRIVLKGED